MPSPRKDVDPLLLAFRVGGVIVAAVLLLQLVLPGGVSAPSWIPWFAGGLIGGWNLKPRLRTRLVALGILVAVWAVFMTAVMFYGGPLSPSANLPLIFGIQLVGGLVGVGASFVGMLLSSGWPGAATKAPASTAAGQVRVRLERGAATEDGVAGRVIEVGPGVDEVWANRRVMMLADHETDEVVVGVDELIALDE